jgi:hypothetical protein
MIGVSGTLMDSGTGPERSSSVRETAGGPAATGSVVPFLETPVGSVDGTFRTATVTER